MSKLVAAENFIRDYLQNAPGQQAASSAVKAAGLEAGHGDRTLKRAAESMDLRIVNTSTVPRRTLWALRSQTTGRTTERITMPNPYLRGA